LTALTNGSAPRTLVVTESGAIAPAARRDEPAPGPPRRPPAGRLLLAGAFGQDNPGDEALLAAFLRELGDYDTIVASSAPAETAAQHGVEAIGRADVAAIARQLARADALVIAGGTVFKTLHPSCERPPLQLLLRLAALTLAAKTLRRPVALVGVGAGALDSRGARRLARTIVHAADLLVLRDEESAARLAAAGAPTPFRVGADSAWTLLEPRTPGLTLTTGNGHGPVVVALSHLAGGRDLPDRLAAGLAPLAGAGVPLRLQPWQLEAGDGALAAAVAARMPDAVPILPPPADLVAARDELSGARLLLGLRFHSLVAAAAAGVPFLAYAHEPKLQGLARRLGQPAVDPAGDPAELTAAVLAALEQPAADPAAVRAERDRSAEGFRMLRVLLAGGRSEEADHIDGLALRPEEWLG
jgi:polysaccharide pyruvyl transferase WcaK-like protein